MPVCAQVHFSRSGFLSLGMIGILVWIILSCEDFSVHCGIFNNVHGLYPIDASNTTFPVMTIKKMFPDIAICALGVEGGARLPLVENHCITELQEILEFAEQQIHQYRPL